MRQPNITDIPKIAIIGGFVLLIIGINMMYGETVDNIKKEIKEIENNARSYTVGDPLTFTLTSQFETLDVVPAQPIFLTIEKDIIFARDTVKITAEAKNVKENVLEIAIILNDGSLSLSNKTQPEILFEKDYADRHELLLKLNGLSDPPFTDEISPTFNKPDITYHAGGAVLLSDPNIQPIQNSDGLFTIYSKINKLQVDTNKSILEQIDKTEITNLQQEITNQIFLGLTVIGIAVVMIVGGCDFWYRICNP